MKNKFKSLVSLLALACTCAANAQVYINEIHRRTGATTNAVVSAGDSLDDNYEFVELKGTANMYTTHNGTITGTPLTLLFVRADGGTSFGRLEEAWKLVVPQENGTEVPMQFGSNGLLLLGDKYTTPDQAVWNGFKNANTAVGDPVGCKAEDLPDRDGLCCLLVIGYTFPATNVLNENPDFDLDDDGMLDWNDPVIAVNNIPIAGGYTTKPFIPYSTSPTLEDYMDSIGWNGYWGTGNTVRKTYVPEVANLSFNGANIDGEGALGAGWHPYTIARYGSNSNRNTVQGGWYGAIVSGGEAFSTAHSTVPNERFNRSNRTSTATWTGSVTPGSTNLSATPTTPIFRISEVNLEPGAKAGLDYNSLNQANATDGNYEYLEIVNTSSAVDKAASLSGHSIVILNSTGEVQEHWDLSKFATGPNGVLLLGDRYPDGYCPFASIVDPLTNFGDPSAPAYAATAVVKFTSMAQGDLGPNNGMTIVLVKNSNATRSSSLNAGAVPTDYDANNDGILDATNLATAIGAGSSAFVLDYLCTSQLSAAGAIEVNRGGYATAINTGGSVNGQMDLTVGARNYNPHNFSRKMSTTNPAIFNNVVGNANWVWGRVGARSENGNLYRMGFVSDPALRTALTPGKVNLSTMPAAPPAGSVVLNEVHINPGGVNDDGEFVELRSTTPFRTLVNCWLVVASTNPATFGEVRGVLDLRNQNTGANGLAIYGDGAEEASFAMDAFISRRTTRDDPQSFSAAGVEDGTLNFAPGFLPNDGAAIFLVLHPTQPVAIGADLDTNDDGIFTNPWTTTLDSVSTLRALGSATVAGATTLPATSIHNIFRSHSNLTANSGAAWLGGELTAAALANGIAYGTSYFGSFKGSASPGRLNPISSTPAESDILLNEVHINPPGGDNNKEFVELKAISEGVSSLNGYSLLLVDSDGNDTGIVQGVVELDGYATGSNGLALIGAGYSAIMPWVGPAAPSPSTAAFEVSGLKTDDLARFTDNGAFTLMLVQNFRGRLGDDLDQGTDANHNAVDDHVLDLNPPWTAMPDAIGMRTYVPADLDVPNSQPSIAGFIFPGVTDVGQANLQYTPDTVARFGGFTTKETAAWYGGNISGTSSLSTEYSAMEKFPSSNSNLAVTPGQPNIQGVLPIRDGDDPDKDGVPHLMEEALGMSDSVPDNHKLPQPGYGVVSGVAQPLFTITRPQGGIPTIQYTTQASFNLVDWDIPVALASTVPNGTGQEVLTYKIAPSLLSALPANKRLFFRLKVSR